MTVVEIGRCKSQTANMITDRGDTLDVSGVVVGVKATLPPDERQRLRANCEDPFAPSLSMPAKSFYAT